MAIVITEHVVSADSADVLIREGSSVVDVRLASGNPVVVTFGPNDTEGRVWRFSRADVGVPIPDNAWYAGAIEVLQRRIYIVATPVDSIT